MQEVLVNCLGGLSLPRKSVVWLNDRPDMTLDVYRGRKTTTTTSSSSFLLRRQPRIECMKGIHLKNNQVGQQPVKRPLRKIISICFLQFWTKKRKKGRTEKVLTDNYWTQTHSGNSLSQLV